MRFLTLAIVIGFLSACVPNRKVVLLQKNDVLTQDLPLDTVVRKFALDTFRYKIQSNDVLSVKFETLTPKEFDFFSLGSAGTNVGLQNALLFGELVDEKGEIPFPVVGKVKVSGLTIFQVQEKLQQVANQYIESPLVKVRLLNYRITVLGEVGHQGTFTLLNNRVTMFEAIGQAGGFSELADRSQIKLIRQVGSETTVQYINLLQEDFMKSPYYYVNQNDILVVRPLRQRLFRNYFANNLALIISSISVVLLVVSLTRR